jgi:type II secretory pathway pseudopilin PulG
MFSTGSKIRRSVQGGFTLVEALAGILLAAVAAGTMADTIVGIMKRSYMTLAVTQASDESERFAAAFTQAGKVATSWAIYPDRAAYLADPTGNASVQGNVLVFQDQLPAGTQIMEMFEYDPAAQTLARYENTLNQQLSLLTKVVPSAGRTTLFEQDLALVQAHWSVQSAYELMEFEAFGTSPRMR